MATALARDMGFSEPDMGRFAIIVSEAAGNLLKHAGHGSIVLSALHQGSVLGVQMLALDRGPGMRSVTASLRDGYSTAGTTGTGFGAISRLSTVFDAYSVPSEGTVVLSQIWPDPAPAIDAVQFGAVSVPVSGETVNGDAWELSQQARRASVLVADGLGHGPEANKAAEEARTIFKDDPFRAPDDMMARMDSALRSTRGAATGLARIDLGQGQIYFTGVGNIAAALVEAGHRRNLISLSGTVGMVMPLTRSFPESWRDGMLLVMHSDGIGSRWDLGGYPGLAQRHPAVIAGVLYRDFAKSRDDATVFVCRSDHNRAESYDRSH
jgi:anti-sigma regulatory factor (Ser/Thr protein kinase)